MKLTYAFLTYVALAGLVMVALAVGAWSEHRAANRKGKR